MKRFPAWFWLHQKTWTSGCHPQTLNLHHMMADGSKDWDMANYSNFRLCSQSSNYLKFNPICHWPFKTNPYTRHQWPKPGRAAAQFLSYIQLIYKHLMTLGKRELCMETGSSQTGLPSWPCRQHHCGDQTCAQMNHLGETERSERSPNLLHEADPAKCNN